MTAPPSFKSFAAPSYLEPPKAGPSSQKLDDDVRIKEKKSKKEDKGSRREKESKDRRSRREDKEKSGRRRSRERDEEKLRSKRRSKERDGERKNRHHQSHRDERTLDRDHDERKHYKDEDPSATDERAKAAEDSRIRSSYISSDPLEKPIFYSDKRGDPANVHYGRLDSKYVPDYRHVAGGRFVLGLANGLTVLYRGSKGVEVGERSQGGRKIAGLADASSRAMLKAPPTHRLIPSERTLRKYEPDVNGVIRLSTRQGKNAQDEPDWRAIEPTKELDVSSEEEQDEEDESEEDGDATPVTAYQERLLALQRATNESPALIEGWTALLAHMVSQVPLPSRGAVKARAEITLSVLERALRTVPSNKATPLQLLYLQAGEEVWEVKELEENWGKMMESEDANADIRAAWFEWRTRRAEGGVEGVLEDAVKAFDAAGQNEMEKLRLFWRVAVLLRQAGFTERALAMFQAQAELVFNCPPSFIGTFLNSRLDKLEQFWESEVPRIGETGARGWAAWLSAGKPRHDAANNTATVPPLFSGDAYQQWSHHESASDRVVRPAIRTSNPAAEEDPYSTIMFADVRPFLFTMSSQRARSAFRLAWLSLLGLHVPGFETSLDPQSSRGAMDDTWAMQHLCASAQLDALFPLSVSQRAGEADAHAGVLIGPEEHYAPSFGPVKTWAYRALGPFEGMDLPPSPGAKWALWGPRDVVDVDTTLARNIFASCRTGADDVEWDALSLCFEAAVGVKGALKLSRSFLASAQDSLPRWAVHARLERLRGRSADARKIYETVLLSSTAEQNRLGTGALWWDWAEMEWLAGDDVAARRVVLRAADVEGDGGVQVLRAKRALAEAATSLPTPLWKAREAWTRLGALLELLAGLGLSHVIDVPSGGNVAAAESAAVAGLSLRYHYVVSHRGRAGDLRERLEEAVSAFPNNTALLGMHLEMQKGRGIWSRARDVVQGGGVGRRVAEVWTAGWVPARWAWEVERARAGLAEAVIDERTRGSAVLWRVWVALEIRAGDLKRAKEVLVQAVAACPLVKELYLPAFGALRSVFSVVELNRLAETMAERGIRMRRILDEAMAIDEDGDVDMSGEEDEIEAESREYSRLKPYAGPYQ